MQFDALARTLTESLHLKQPPVAVTFTDEIPPGVAAFEGSVPAGCRFWQEASTRVFATVPRDHELCAIGMYTHRLEGNGRVQTDLGDAMKVFGDLGYVRPEDMPFIPVMERASKVVVYGPLASMPLAPDVVLLFVAPEQT